MALLVFGILFLCAGVRQASGQASDKKAVRIAEQVMAAIGGAEAWEATRHIEWTFFGRRTLLWDKHKGLCRIEVPKDELVMRIDLHTKTGEATRGGQRITQPDSLKKMMNIAWETWINDSYWLVMPFKLRDPGVVLTYIGEDTTLAGDMADMVQLIFDDVGPYPEHKYRIWVDKKTHLVRQWAFYKNWEAGEPQFITPWDDYTRKGEILLSGNRGKAKLDGISVYKRLPKKRYRVGL